MTRRILDISTSVTIDPVSPGNDLKTWLVGFIGESTFMLLAHLDDGVLWGRIGADGVTTGDQFDSRVSDHPPLHSFTPPLRLATLQTLRLFNEDAEGLMWRETDGWHWRWIIDGAEVSSPTYVRAFDETHILWGTDAVSLGNGFTLMSDGAQGLRHIVPIEVNATGDINKRPLRLHIRTYVQADDSGFARVAASRLVKLAHE